MEINKIGKETKIKDNLGNEERDIEENMLGGLSDNSIANNSLQVKNGYFEIKLTSDSSSIISLYELFKLIQNDMLNKNKPIPRYIS